MYHVLQESQNTVSAGVGGRQDVRIVKHRVTRVGLAGEGQVDLWLVHLRVVFKLPDELGNDVAFSIVDSLAGPLCVGLCNLAAGGKNRGV